MPELPEVEFARSCLTRWLGGERIVEAHAAPSRVLRPTGAKAVESLGGHRIKQIERKGKWLLWELDGGLGILSHLGMTGKFELQHPKDPDVRWSRVSLTRKDGARIHLQDPRMFGRFSVGPLEELRSDEGFAALGPDAWDEPLSASALHDVLSQRKRAVKDVLMDQTVMAGVGNIQATEALWKAGVHPAREASSLSKEECAALVKGIRWTLKRTLAMNKGDKITYVEESGEEDNPFLIYGKAGEPCPECGIELEKLIIGGRTSAFCPQHQRLRPRRT